MRPSSRFTQACHPVGPRCGGCRPADTPLPGGDDLHDPRAVPRAVVIGGSVAGLTVALALSRVGWSVDVLERDPLPDAADAEQAFACDPRPAVPVISMHDEP